MNKDELYERIQELDVQITSLSEERAELRQRHAEKIAGFKVGDRVKIDGGEIVWELTAIRPGYSDVPKYFGAKIKKDGTLGLLRSEIWVPYRKTLVLAE